MDAGRLTRAFELALSAHDGQVRKGTRIPYVSHPMAVASIVMEDGGSEDEVIGALLHDVVEDSGEEFIPTIRDAFGSNVLRIVLECSDAVGPKGGEKPPWRERKERYLAEIPAKSASAIRVTTADKLHNAPHDPRGPARRG